MLDKIEVRIPFGAGFKKEFRFLPGELRYAGVSSIVRKSQHYAGTCDLRPFSLDAILHLNFKRRGIQNHKLVIME